MINLYSRGRRSRHRHLPPHSGTPTHGLRRAFQPQPPSLPIYAHIMLARPRTLPTGFIAPCLPTKVYTLPSGGLWLHEIKQSSPTRMAHR
jgi:hypothetical protein